MSIKFPQVVELIKQSKHGDVIRLNPIQIGEADSRAMEVLDRLYQKYPNLTHGEVLEILQDAVWWCITMQSMTKYELKSEG